jgi:hypothetical protein
MVTNSVWRLARPRSGSTSVIFSISSPHHSRRREDLDGIAAHPEGAAVKIDVVPLVLHVDQAPEHGVATHLLALFERERHAGVRLLGTDAVDARDRRHDDDVPAREQREGRRVTHAVDLFVDHRVLLDVRVRGGNVRLGLVIVVVRDKVVDRVLGKEVLELPVELRGEGLVGSDDERRPVHLLDDIGDREGLAGAGDAEEHLAPVLAVETGRELADRARLVAGRNVLRDELESGGGAFALGHPECRSRLARGTGHCRQRNS